MADPSPSISSAHLRLLTRASGALVVLVATLVVQFFLAPGASAQRNDGTEYDANAEPTWQVANAASSAFIPDGTLVRDFAEINGRIYVVGKFQEVRENSASAPVNQSFLAAFDLDTGAWVSSFTPTLNGPAFGLEVSADGQRLLVGGEFDTVNGVATGALVALDPTTGALAAGFDANISHSAGPALVYDMERANGGLYIGGFFDTVTSAAGLPMTRYSVLKVNDATGRAIGTFNANVGGERVLSIDVSPNNNRVYIGGYFSHVNGTEVGQFAVVNAYSGTLLGGVHQGVFDDTPWCCGGVVPFDIESVGDKVFVAAESHLLLVLNAADLSRVGFYFTAFGGGDYQALEVSPDGRVYAGGHYWATQNYDTGSYPNQPTLIDYIDAVHKTSTEVTPSVWGSAYDASSGANDGNFAPDFSAQSGVWAIFAASDGSLWFGGDLSRAGYREVGGFAKLKPVAVDAYGENLALDQLSTQSSTSAGRGASLANDRLLSGGAGTQQYAATTVELNPWWEVDLGSVRDIAHVRAWQSTLCCTGGLDGAQVFVSSSPFASNDPAVLAADPGVFSYTIGSTIRRAEVPVDEVGRYVRIAKTGTTDLALDEVQVFASTIPVGAPVAPTACTAVETPTDVDLSWTRAANDRADRFVVRRSTNGGAFGWSASVSAPNTLWADGTARVGSSYSYTVETIKGTRVSAPITCAPDPLTLAGGFFAPVRPTSCTAVEVDGAVAVTWTPAADDNAARYVVRRIRDAGTLSWAAAVQQPGSTWTDTGVVIGSEYRYRVETVNAAGDISARRACAPNPITVAGTAPVAPTTCTVSPTASTAQVSWTRAGNDNADRFIVRRSRNGAASSWAASIAVPLAAWTDASVVVGSSYSYSVQSVAGPNLSAATTCVPDPVVITGAQPVAPAACTVSQVGGNVAVSWTRAGNDNATRFVVRRSRNGGADSWAASVNVPGTAWTDSNVANGSSYRYTVTTVAGINFSPPRTCNPNPIVVNAGGPVRPASCSVSVVGGNVSVAWTRAGNDNADRFIVRRSRNAGPVSWASSTNVPGTSWTDTNVVAGSSYAYTVETVAGAVFSNARICTPNPIVP
jgi:fibronectin type 3 domain-containing protein